MPRPRGKSVSTHWFLDANHAREKNTRRSMTGILIFCNTPPIIWHSKRQNSVDMSSFGSEFTAMKNSVELVAALRYKLRMFGVPIDGSTDIFCDNEAAYKNASTPEYQLRKKHLVYRITEVGRWWPVVHAGCQSKILRLTSQISSPRCYRDQGGNCFCTVSLIE